MYRWGVDLCGPFEATSQGHRFVMVCVEHFSKHLELVPIPDKEPHTTAAAFAAAVLGRYGSPAEVLTDGGGEWMKEFDQQLLSCMVDHRNTSASHPEANGLTERCVATVKRALAKLCAAQGNKDEWHLHLPWLMLGYNASPQKSTGFSPYQLMHATTPVVPPAIRERLQEPFEWEDNDAVAADFLHRAELVKQRCVIAADNLQAAQHRDTLRYAKLRSGFYTPKMHTYLPGDYVYVRQHDKAGLDLPAKKLILRVAEVRPSGVLVLQGRCGKLQHVNSNNCAPCHLPNIDPAVDWSLRKGPEDAVCEKCGDDDEAAKGKLIFCDNCNGAWHLSCHNPVLNRNPRGTWVCCDCLQQGVTIEMIKASQRDHDQLARQQLQPERYTAGQQQDKALHGRLILRTFTRDLQGNNVTRSYLGTVYFRGRQPGGALLVAYEDGDAEITTRQSLRDAGVEWLPEGAPIPAGVTFPTASEAEDYVRQSTQQRNAAAHQGPRRPAAANGRTSNRATVNNSEPAVVPQPGMRTRARARQSAAVSLAAATSSPPLATPRAAASIHTAGVIASGTPVLTTTTEICLVATHGYNKVELPDYWCLQSTAGVQTAMMQMLMPGQLPAKDATRICNSITKILDPLATPAARGFVPTDPAEIQVLLDTINFGGCSSFYDPYAGSGTISRVFAQAGFRVVQNDIDASWGHANASDALQPGNYAQDLQVIVTSPPFDLLDLAAPIAANAVGVVACIHVPGHWLSNPRVARQKWLQDLAASNRVHVVMGLPRGAMHKRCAWLLIFSSSCKRRQLLRCTDAAVPCSFANH